MSLKDMTQETMYPSLRRFLDSRVGTYWDNVYSRICEVAPANTERGLQLRKAVTHYVDTEGPALTRWPNDYYVDLLGILRRVDKTPWKRRYKARMDKEPIIKVNFVEDGNDIWFELVTTNNTPQHSPYATKARCWFQFIRKHIDSSYPIYEYVNGKQGRQIGTRPSVHEEIHKRQCNSKEVKVLKKIAAREHKILKLTSQKADNPGLIAYVSGNSKKGIS